nr:hypothetical protein [candidate division KSB1 bacterium]NIV69139.1 hypothetical protein [Phycisphaerae bacterium]NIS25707.1 hypothetical protein [candidate division KSB1 bacterium]NIT72570.1 hypothetical protein [candidate division KSB1 bacterium]NIU26390.1 hypothetical protein [candidate division KSB1 bacterium]
TAIAGKFLGINPFDQPNVEAAKVLAKKMVSAYQEEGTLPSLTPSFEENGIRVYADVEANDLSSAWSKFLSLANAGENEGKGRSYVSIQAYVKPDSQTDEALQKLRDKIQTTQRLAVTSGYGPRFLHSTGQLHKGDAGNGLFIQLTSDIPATKVGLRQDVPIPDQPGEDRSSIRFGILKDAQALGDRQALLDANRKVIRFHLTTDVASSITRLAEAIS